MANRKRAKREVRYADAKKRADTHESGSGVSSFKIPEGMPLFQIKKAGIYKFDIVPFISNGSNPCAEEGDLWYERTFFTHRGIGPEQKSYCCLARTFKKRCPVDEDLLSMRRSNDPDPELIKGLQPKERQLFVIIDRNDAETGMQLFEYSYHLFGKMLDEKIKSSDEEDGYDKFFRLEGGMTLKVTFREESMGTNKFFKCSNIEMRPRKEDLPESLLDEVPCLDELPIELTYDKLKALYEMSDGDEEEDEDKPKGGKKKVAAKSKAKDDDEDEDIDDEEPEDEDEDEDEDLDDEDEPEEKPAPKRKPGRPKKVKEPEPEDDDDEDSDEDADEDDDDSDDPDADEDDSEDDSDDDAFDDEDEEEDDDEPTPPKRKPGRPKKK